MLFAVSPLCMQHVKIEQKLFQCIWLTSSRDCWYTAFRRRSSSSEVPMQSYVLSFILFCRGNVNPYCFYWLKPSCSGGGEQTPVPNSSDHCLNYFIEFKGTFCKGEKMYNEFQWNDQILYIYIKSKAKMGHLVFMNMVHTCLNVIFQTSNRI